MGALIWEGFKRYRRRRKNLTWILIISCSMLFFFYSFFRQMSANVNSLWVDHFVGGDVIVDARAVYYDFFKPLSLEHTFSFSLLKQKLNKTAPILAPRLRTSALFEKKQEVPLVVIGIDPTIEQNWGEHIIVDEGRWCNPGAMEVILTASTASRIGVELGDQLIFTTSTASGLPSYELLTVCGFIVYPNVSNFFGSALAYMPLDSLQQLTELTSDQVNEVAVPYNPFVRYSLNKDYRCIPGSDTLSVSRLIGMVIILISVLLFLVLGSFLVFTISHHVMMMMDERSQEIGVYLIFGASPSWIRSMFTGELMLYTAYCVFIGCGIGTALVLAVNSLGLYAFNMATEILMSTSYFTIQIMPGTYMLCFIIFILIVGAASSFSLVRNTERKSLRALCLS